MLSFFSDNIGINQKNQPVIFDMGFAREIHTIKDSEVAGSIRYMSPEMATGGTVTFAHDVYSYGVLLYEVSTLERPFKKFKSREEFTENVFFGDYRPRLTPVSSKEIRKLIASCWDKDPKERPSISQVVKTLRVETALSGLGLKGKSPTSSSSNILQVSSSHHSMLGRLGMRPSSKNSLTKQSNLSDELLNLTVGGPDPSLNNSKNSSFDASANPSSAAAAGARLLLRSSSKNSLSNNGLSSLSRTAQSAGDLGMDTEHMASLSNSKNFSWSNDAVGSNKIPAPMVPGSGRHVRRTLSKNSLSRNALTKHSNLSHDSLVNALGHTSSQQNDKKNFTWDNPQTTGKSSMVSAGRQLLRSSSSKLSRGSAHSNGSVSSQLSTGSLSSQQSDLSSFGRSEFTFGLLAKPVKKADVPQTVDLKE